MRWMGRHRLLGGSSRDGFVTGGRSPGSETPFGLLFAKRGLLDGVCPADRARSGRVLFGRSFRRGTTVAYTGAMRFAWTLAPFLLLAACAAPDAAKDDAPADKEDDFAVGQVSAATSILPAIENSAGKIEVCVGLIGFPKSEIEIAKKKVTSSVTATANAWNELLKGNPLWTLPP